MLLGRILSKSYSYAPRILNDNILKYIQGCFTKYQESIAQLASSELDHSQREEVRRAISSLEGLSESWKLWREKLLTFEQVEAMEANGELADLAKLELEGLTQELCQLEEAMKRELLRPDEDDSSSAILEVRAGTGGDEAAIFTAELFQMYQRFSELSGWGFETVSLSEDGPNALRVLPAYVSHNHLSSRKGWLKLKG